MFEENEVKLVLIMTLKLLNNSNTINPEIIEKNILKFSNIKKDKIIDILKIYFNLEKEIDKSGKERYFVKQNLKDFEFESKYFKTSN